MESAVRLFKKILSPDRSWGSRDPDNLLHLHQRSVAVKADLHASCRKPENRSIDQLDLRMLAATQHRRCVPQFVQSIYCSAPQAELKA